MNPQLLALLSRVLNKQPGLIDRAMVQGLSRGRSPEMMSRLKESRLQGPTARAEDKVDAFFGSESSISKALKKAKGGRKASKEVEDLRIIEQLLQLLGEAPRPVQGPSRRIDF